MKHIAKQIFLFSILFCIKNIWLNNGVYAQTICAQTGSNPLSTLIGTVSNCPAPVSYNITSSTATGVVVATGVTTIIPTTGGTIVVEILNATGGVCGTRTINVVNTNFTSVPLAQCLQVEFTPPAGNPTGTTYQYLVDGNVISTSSGVFTHTFNNGGSVNVTITATFGNCSYTQTLPVTVPGPSAGLTFEGDLNDSGTYSPLSVTNYQGNTSTVAFCKYNGTLSNNFNLNFSPISTNACPGIIYTVLLNGGQIYSGAIPPSTISQNFQSSGFVSIEYRINCGGCISSRTYQVYMAVDDWNITASIASQSSVSTFCIEQDACFNIIVPAINPSDMIYWFAISCGDPGQNLNSSNIIHLENLGSLPAGNNIHCYTTTQSSCGCPNNEFIAEVYFSNPCIWPPQRYGNQIIKVVLNEQGEFSHVPIICRSTSQAYTWESANQIIASVPICHPALNWTITNQSTNTVVANSSNAGISYNYPQSGNHEVCLNVSLSSCSSSGPTTVCHNVCVTDNPTGNLTWGFNQNQQVCLSNGSYQITPTFVMANGLNFCGQNVQYNWTVLAPSGIGCITNTPCFTFSTGTQNTPNPIINLNCSGSYTITCTVSIQGMNCTNFSQSQTIILVAPPQFQLPSDGCSACLGQGWSPSDCITINTCNGGAITSSGFNYNNSSIDSLWNANVVFPSGPTASVILNASTTVDNAPCASTQTITVTVADPPNPVINGPASVCPGEQFDLNLTNACNGQLSVIGGGNVTNMNGLEISVPTQYQYLCNVGGCPGGDTLLVDVHPLPVVTIIPPASNPCAGGEATFGSNVTPAIGTYTYQWTLNSVNVNMPNTNTSYTLNPNNNDNIGLTVTDANGCEGNDSYTVTQATVNVTLDCPSSPPSYCTNSDPFNIPQITINTSGVSLDSTALNGVVFTGNTINPSTLLADHYVITYYYSDSNCSYSDTCGFNVANPSTVTITPNNTQMCMGTSLDFNYNPSNVGSNPAWSSTPNPSYIDLNGVFTPENIGSYTISINGDCIVPTQIDIDVVPNPTGAITSPLAMCATQSIPLTGTTNPLNTVTWTVNGSNVTSPLNPNGIGLAVANHQLCMHIVDNNGCITDECETISVSNAAPNPPTLNCNPVFSHYCYDMPCENIPAPTIPDPAAWTLVGQTWNGAPFNQTQICAGQGQFTQGSHQLVYSFMDNIGCPMPITCVIDIFDVTNVTIQYSDDLTICESETIQFSTTPSTAPYGQWSCTQCPTCINSNGLFTPPNVSTQTTYTIVYDDFCVANTSVVVTVNPNPFVTTTPVNALCINVNAQLQSTTSADVTSSGWEWNGNALPGNVFDPTQLNLNAGQQYELCFIGENQYGCADDSCFDIDIIGLPSPIVLSATGIHCLATDFIVPVNNQVDYTVVFTHTVTGWVIGPFGETELVPFLDNNGTYDYEITITSTMGCVITQNGQLVVMDDPVADISVTSYSICNPVFNIENNSTGDNITYDWSSDLSLDNLNNVLPTPNQQVEVPTTPTDQFYDITLTISNLCNTSTDNVVISFVAAPVADIDITSPLSNFNCAEFCVDLLAQSPSTSNISQVVYSWPGFETVDGLTFINANNLNPIDSICFDTYEAATIILQVQISNPCGTDIATVPLNIVPAQVNAEFEIPDFVCPGNSIPINDLSFPQGGATVAYSISPSGQGVYVANGMIVAMANATPGSYSITQNVTGCGSDSQTEPFTVGVLPNIQLQAIQGIYCTGELIDFTATQTEPNVLNWDFGNGVSTVGYSNIQYAYFEPGVYQVTVTGTSSTGCPGSATGSVTVSGDDDYIILSDSIICGSSRITGRTSNVVWISIVWTLSPSIDGPVVGTDEFIYDFINSTNELMTYTLQMDLTNVNGCVSRDIRTITVKPSPHIALEWEQGGDCDKIPYRDAIIITDFNLANDWNYHYSMPDAIDTARVRERISGTFYSSQKITVSARNNFGCESTAEIDLNCNEWPFYVPNAFTPDDDKINDFFKPVFSNHPVDYDLWIFDRWGEAVFHSKDPDEPWIGDYNNKKTHFAPDGVYNWLIEYSYYSPEGIKKEQKRGHVSILR